MPATTKPRFEPTVPLCLSHTAHSSYAAFLGMETGDQSFQSRFALVKKRRSKTPQLTFTHTYLWWQRNLSSFTAATLTSTTTSAPWIQVTAQPVVSGSSRSRISMLIPTITSEPTVHRSSSGPMPMAILTAPFSFTTTTRFAPASPPAAKLPAVPTSSWLVAQPLKLDPMTMT